MSKYSSYLLNLFFLSLFFFTVPFAKAQLLWEISGNNLKQKSYLFGTVHVGDERVIDYASNVYPYMDNSLTVAGELDLNFMTSILAIGYVMSPADSTLSKLLTKEEYQEIKPYLAKKIGELAPFLDMVRPVFIMAMLQEKEQEELAKATNKTKKGESATLEKFPALDMHLQNRARENEQNVIGLETVKEQMTALNSTPIDKQARELYDYIVEKNKLQNEAVLQDSVKVEVDVAIVDDVNKNDTTLVELQDTANPMEILISLYLSENIELLHDQISGEFEKESYQSLIVRRNIVMVQRMEEQMRKELTKEFKQENKKSKKNTIFAAVGAGHLGGKEGMVNLLKEAGYTLTPIFFNKN
ncbi:TraB/GumN family protein [Bernardetia sp. OM2101]|uniref:TraB/GumN family protein n=1 Tax=Bernardetia sp. OM2101 TaxID=3344876 RepID=UPI0035CF08C8